MAAAAAALLFGTAAGQFAGVTPGTLPGVLQATQCPQVLQLPLREQPVVVNPDTTVSLSVEAWCGGQPLPGLATTGCGVQSSFVLLDDGDLVSDLESQVVVEVEPGTTQTLILIDLSNSISSQLNLEQGTKLAVEQLIGKLFEGQATMGGLPSIAVYSFNGAAETNLIHDWSSDQQSLINRVRTLSCDNPAAGGGTICGDPSTNLYGTTVWAANVMAQRASVAQLRQTTRGFDGSLVIFTDGVDLANRATAAEARAAITNAGLLVFAIGVRQQDMTLAEQRAKIQLLTGDPAAALIGEQLTDIPNAAAQAASFLVNYYSRSYKITFCSPRRRLSHTVDVRVWYQNQLSTTRMSFIVGQRVVYRPVNAASVFATITAVNQLPNQAGVTYTIRLDNSQETTTVPGTLLEHFYDTATFVPPYSCPLRNQLTLANACQSVAGSAVAPYSCTGGSEYDCQQGACTCAAAPVAQCTPDACMRTEEYIPSLLVQTSCPGGLPASPIPIPASNFTVLQDSTLSLRFTPRCANGDLVGGLTFSPCSDLSSLRLYETDASGDYDAISLYESRPRITCVPQPAHVITLMLLDMSDSIRRGYGSLARLKQYAMAYLDGIQADLRSHTVAVYTFDGQERIVLAADFGSPTAAKQAIASIECNAERCRDFTTNLNGAVVLGSRRLQEYHSLNRYANDGVLRQPFLAIFSDGADQAQYYSDLEARTVGNNGTGVFGIGLQGEVRSVRDYQTGTWQRRGVDVERFRLLANSGLYVRRTPELLRESFSKVGQAISSAAARSYRLDYCSPKRTGQHRFKLELTVANGNKMYWEQAFDATNFACNGGLCNSCLGGASQVNTFTCAAQPTQADQTFVCEGGRQPISRDGYCRCPCDNEANYPSANYIGPGPIICEKQGTCSRGDRVSCSKHGGLPRQPFGPSGFERFDVASSSRISMEFRPMCADDWPMPQLKLSACNSLSDFRIYETDSAGVESVVSPFESEPRVLCYPDVVSIILLDTSGSVRIGEGEANLRQAVLAYLDAMEARLTVGHNVAIYAFDGQQQIQVIQDFTKDYSRVRASMQSWSCGGMYCNDPSTNLYGAILQTIQVLNGQMGTDSWSQSPYFILFSDGTDQAGFHADTEAFSAVSGAVSAYNMQAYAIGLRGERMDGSMGLDEASLRALAPAGVFVADSGGALGGQFSAVAESIIDQTDSLDSATYRIDYCTPKRNGLTNVTVELRHENAIYRWSRQFDASVVTCQGEQCRSCLTARKFSCDNQPAQGIGGGEQQAFTCLDGRTPIEPAERPGQCMCPCDGIGTYPPSVTPVPTTIPGGTPYPPILAQPSFSPPSGTTHPSQVAVSIIYADTSASVHYTADGSTPTAASPVYTGTPIVWTQPGTTTMRAVAFRNGQPVSGVGSAVYTIGTGTAPPTTCTNYRLSGFTLVPQLNQIYTMDSTRPISGFPTYWSQDSVYFYYYCTPQSRQDTGNQWRIAKATVYSLVARTDDPICNSIARQEQFGTELRMNDRWLERRESESTYTPTTVSFMCDGNQVTPIPTPFPGTGNIPPSAVVAIPTVSGVLGANSVAGVFTGISGGESTDTVTSTCVPTDSSLFSQGVQMSVPAGRGAGNVAFNAVRTGSSVVSCTLRDSRGGTAVRQFTVVVGSGTQPPSSGLPTLRFRVPGLPASFDVAAFTTALNQLFAANGNAFRALPNWACPETACFENNLCPVAGVCRVFNGIVARGAAVQQSSSMTHADFLLRQTGTNAALSPAQIAQALQIAQGDVARCLDSQPCYLGNWNVRDNPVTVPPGGVARFAESDAADDDDSGLEDWEVALIIVGAALCLLLLLLAIFFLACRKKEKKQPKDVYDDAAYGGEMQPAAYDDGKRDSYYPSSQPREGESRSYYEDSYYTSQSYDGEVFNIDDPVQALYVDGQWYGATVWAVAPDGTYEVKWYDGTHSEGIPPEQLRRE